MDWTVAERLDNLLVEGRPSEIGGSGLFAKVPFATGEMICSYAGLPVAEAERRAMTDRGDPRRFYIMRCGEEFLLPDDLTALGGHLANHSCDPNADFRRCPERPSTCAFYARRRIRPGEEICIYYAWTSFISHPCHCGARRCSGNIGLRLLTSEQGEVGYSDDDVVELLRTGYANRNDACRLPLHHLKEMSPLFATDEAWAAQLDHWFTLSFGRKWKRSPVFRWFFSNTDGNPQHV